MAMNTSSSMGHCQSVLIPSNSILYNHNHPSTRTKYTAQPARCDASNADHAVVMGRSKKHLILEALLLQEPLPC